MEQLLPILQKLLNGIEQGIDTMPEVANELLRYELTSSYIWLTLSLLTLAAAIVLFRKVRKLGFFEGGPEGVVISIFIGLTALIVLTYHIDKIIKITIAPKVYIIQRAADLVGK